jgi:hypothetical protein
LEDIDDHESQLFGTDIALVETGDAARHSARGAAIATVEPIVVYHQPSRERNRWIEIIDTSEGNRVTAIEILSPGNKSAGKLNRKYRRKLERYAEAGVNIVEIDLLRSSRDRLVVPENEIPPERRAAYYTCVCWVSEPAKWEIYPMLLRRPLPTVPVPCRNTDPDVPLNLQPLIDRIYTEGGHDDIDYSKPPKPPLPPDDAAWAAELIAKSGRAGNGDQSS